MNSAQDTLAGGLPHSEIPGSTIARISPGLFAACHVLHRLSVPRHPPDALILRLSATPNGKNHADIRRDITGQNRRCDKTLLTQKTLCAGSQHSPPDKAIRPHAVSRLGHTTRFFTMSHQQNAPASPTDGDAGQGMSRVLLAAFASSPGATAFRGLLRKPLSARKSRAPSRSNL